MLDEKDLQMIAQLLDQKLDQRLAQQKEEILKETNHQMKVLLDAEVTPKFNLLADAIQDIRENQIPHSRIEVLEDDVKLLKVIVRQMSERVRELEKAN